MVLTISLVWPFRYSPQPQIDWQFWITFELWDLGFVQVFEKSKFMEEKLRSESQVTTQEFAEKLEKEVSKPSATQRNVRLPGMFCRPYFWDAWVGRQERDFFFWERLILYDPVQKMQLSRDWTRWNWISDLQCNFQRLFTFMLLGCFPPADRNKFWDVLGISPTDILSHVFDTEVTTLMHRFPIQTCWGKERPPGCNLKKLFSKIKGLEGLRSAS